MGIPFCPGEILIPKDKDNLNKWSVVACDQFTSQPEYWEELKEYVGDADSTLNIIFPEAYLDKLDFDEKIGDINKTMKSYLRGGIFDFYRNCMVYVERTLANGQIRRGIVGLIDLNEYDYRPKSKHLVRATEQTVLERIPPRVHIREKAPLEAPHVMLLIDDPEKTIIEQFDSVKDDREVLYDFDLNMDGGHIKGYKMKGEDYLKVMGAVNELSKPEVFAEKYNVYGRKPMVFAVGDGNHSLAAAKACYEKRIEKGSSDALTMPARYALVEVCNLHDDSLQFEAIHRAVFDVDNEKFVSELKDYCEHLKGGEAPHEFTIVYNGKEEVISVPSPMHYLPVGTVQEFIDGYLSENGGKVDYIHGEDVTRNLSADGAVGIILPAMEKESLFPTIIEDGALPRKTFSMGEGRDKRYYLECRKIK